MSRTVYVNGSFVPEGDAKISIFDRAFLFAEGVYEVTAVLGGRPIDLENHLARLDRSLVVGISQSGASPDVVAVVAAGRAQGAPTLAITNDPSSPLAETAETTIDLGAGPELAVAATKTYTTELLAIASLSAALSRDPSDAAALDAVPDAMASALELEPAVESMARDQAGADRLLVLARGYEYATAPFHLHSDHHRHSSGRVQLGPADASAGGGRGNRGRKGRRVQRRARSDPRGQ